MVNDPQILAEQGVKPMTYRDMNNMEQMVGQRKNVGPQIQQAQAAVPVVPAPPAPPLLPPPLEKGDDTSEEKSDPASSPPPIPAPQIPDHLGTVVDIAPRVPTVQRKMPRVLSVPVRSMVMPRYKGARGPTPNTYVLPHVSDHYNTHKETGDKKPLGDWLDEERRKC